MNEVLEKKEEGMEQTAPPTAPAAPLVKKKKKKSVWKRIVALVLVVALILAVLKFCGKEGGSGGEGEVMTDIVSYGSITSVVEGSGITKAKTSETLTLSTVGTVLDVFVTEGQTVAPGDPLFTIDSPSAETAVQNARNRVEGLEKQLSGDQTRRELKKRILEAISPEDSPFRTELISSFARSFRTYVKSLAEAAEIPIQ